jgi:hypothetical protein
MMTATKSDDDGNKIVILQGNNYYKADVYVYIISACNSQYSKEKCIWLHNAATASTKFTYYTVFCTYIMILCQAIIFDKRTDYIIYVESAANYCIIQCQRQQTQL